MKGQSYNGQNLPTTLKKKSKFLKGYQKTSLRTSEDPSLMENITMPGTTSEHSFINVPPNVNAADNIIFDDSQ
jgi:hypothetical protein